MVRFYVLHCRLVLFTLVFLLCPCFPLIVDVFPSVIVCNPDLCLSQSIYDFQTAVYFFCLCLVFFLRCGLCTFVCLFVVLFSHGFIS